MFHRLTAPQSAPILRRVQQALGGAALAATATLIFLGGAEAQALLLPMALSAAPPPHHLKALPLRRDLGPNSVLSGRSIVTPPQAGSAATRALFGPFILPPTASASLTANWLSVGPSSVQNAQGTIGGNTDAVSGRVAAIAVDPKNTKIFYVAAAGGGVWKTTDGGSTYLATTDFLGDTAMGSIAVAPNNSNVVYAGTGEANNSGDSQYGIGLLKSTTGGMSWSVIPGPSSAFYRRAISKIVVNPTNASIVYLTIADFAENGLGGNTGVWKTTDGGSTWTNTTAAAGLDSFEPYSDLAIDPSQPNTLYAAIGDLYGADSNGVYKTTDGGTTWKNLSGFPTTNVGRISLALAPSTPTTLYASVSSTADYSLLGFYKTTDSGTTWTQMTAAPNYLGGQGWYDNAIVVSPTNANQVFAGGQVNYSGNYGSLYALVGTQDGGATFQDYSIGVGTIGPHTDLHALTFLADGSALLDGNDGGMWRLENPNAAGDMNVTQWTDLNTNLDTIQFTGIALHPTDPTIAYGGSQDNGTEKYTGSLAWTQVRGGDGGFTRVDQSNPNTVYHEYYGISLERSDDGGQTWNGATNGINPNDPQPADGSDPAAFYVPFKLDPDNQSRVIYATDHVYESTDRGDDFTAIGTPNTNGYNPNDEIVSTLGVAGNTIYAAANGSLFVTFNDGTSWTDVSIPNFNGRYSDIFVNPTNTKDVYVSRSTFGGGKVYHSTNGGTSWSDVTGNLPDEPFNAILPDPAFGKIYTGGDDGVYVSSNSGSSWSRLDPSSVFPRVQVVDLALSPGANVIAAGTHGRGLFEVARSTATVTVSGLSLSPTSVKGGSATSTGTVILTGPAPTGGLAVTLKSSNTSAATLAATLNIAAGATSAKFKITTYAVASTQTVTITASANGTSKIATLTVTGGTASVTVKSLSLSPTSVKGGTSSTGTITLTGSAPTGGLAIAQKSSDTSAATLAGTLNIPAGATSANFKITTYAVSSTKSVTITSSANGASVTATLTVTGTGTAPVTVQSLSLSPTSVKGGSATSTGTVILTGPAPAGGLAVTQTSSNTSAATLAGTLNIAAGATSAKFKITTYTVASTQTVTITASANGTSKSQTLTVTH